MRFGAGALLAIALGVACIAPATRAVAAEPPGVKNFIEALFEDYAENEDETAEYGDAFRAEFDEALGELVRTDEERNANGGAGCIDFDPLVDSKISDGLRHEIQSISGSDAAATAVVHVSFAPKVTPNSKLVTFRLTDAKDGWHIADIETEARPSFRAWLAACLKAKK